MSRLAILIDAHVHFHEGFALERFFDSAAANFERAGEALGLATSGPHVLMLAECAGVHAFDRWWSGPVECSAGWSFEQTREERSLLACRDGRPSLVIVAGRQIVTAERLEVLALGLKEELAEGRALDATLDDVRAAGALPVLPWGVGKWIGRRGALVRGTIEQCAGRALFLGDNGGRWGALPRPFLLRRAERAGVPVLPGSDPLPLSGQERRVGAFGCALRAGLDPHEPATHLLAALRDAPELTPYGSGVGLLGFLGAQLSLRLGGRSPPPTRR